MEASQGPRAAGRRSMRAAEGAPVAANGTAARAADRTAVKAVNGTAQEAAGSVLNEVPAAGAAVPVRRSGPPGRPRVALLPCDLVMVPARQGLEAVDILRRGEEPAVGPVIHDGPGNTLGFLVPPGTADAWDLPGSACTRTDGRGARLPSDPPVVGTGWLLAPSTTGDAVTDPTRLREALGKAARTIEAADGRGRPPAGSRG